MLGLALAGICGAVACSLLFILLMTGMSAGARTSGALSLLGFASLYASTTVSVFFNVALACAASAAFDGERMDAREAIGMAWTKRRRIALWALISALIGTLIAEVANRLPGGARLAGGLLGVAWGLATFFVIPILALEGVGAVDALKRSSSLVRQRWGEGLTGRISITAWTLIAIFPLVTGLTIGIVLLRTHPETGAVLIGCCVVCMAAVFTASSATQQVFAVALYRYAIDAPIGGFAPTDLDYPFAADASRGPRKSWILRIGGAFLGLFALLMVIGLIFGSHHHTAAEGYFKIEFARAEVTGLGVGSPVVLGNRQIGSVTSTELDGVQVRVEFHVDPRLRSLIETTPAHIEHVPGGAYMRISQPPQPPGAASL